MLEARLGGALGLCRYGSLGMLVGSAAATAAHQSPPAARRPQPLAHLTAQPHVLVAAPLPVTKPRPAACPSACSASSRRSGGSCRAWRKYRWAWSETGVVDCTRVADACAGPAARPPVSYCSACSWLALTARCPASCPAPLLLVYRRSWRRRKLRRRQPACAARWAGCFRMVCCCCTAVRTLGVLVVEPGRGRHTSCHTHATSGALLACGAKPPPARSTVH